MRIFLGYPSEHVIAAKQIYEILLAQGYEVWFDKDALDAGTAWDEERIEGQREADVVIHLCSREMLYRSGTFLREMRLTLQLSEEQPFDRIYAIFVRIEPFLLPAQLLRFHYIDKFDMRWPEPLLKALARAQKELGGCRYALTETTPMTATPQPFQRYDIEEVTDRYECKASFVAYAESGPYWELVNSECKAHALRGYVGSIADFTSEEWGPALGSSSWFEYSAEEAFRTDDVVSIRASTNSYHGGAAHPNHMIETMNFGGRSLGIFTIKDFIGYDASAARNIVEYCNNILAEEDGVQVGDQSDILSIFTQKDEQAWNILSAGNLTRNGMIFNFSSAVGLPHVMGFRDALVPWDFLMERMSYRFVPLGEKIRSDH